MDKFGEGNIVISKPEFFGSYVEEYDSLGNVLSHTDYYLTKSYISNEAIYNDKGIELKWTSYESDGSIDYEYTYNDKGQEISWKSYDDGKLKYSKKYEYNEKGDRIREIDMLDGDVENIQIKYNDIGQQTYYKDNLSTIVYEYDNKLLRKKTRTFRVGYYYKSVDVTNYKYNDKEQLIEEIAYDDGKLEETQRYEYNDKNLLVKHFIEKEGKVECSFYKYDHLGRRVDILKADGENPDKSTIKERQKLFYANDMAKESYRRQYWNENGKLEYDNYDVCFLMSGDTLSVVSFNINHEITSIRRFMSRGENLHRVTYRMDCDPNLIKYNYVSGLLISKRDETGYTTNYEYDNGEMIKEIKETYKGKIITLYEDRRPISETKYDENNKIEWSITLENEGNLSNGKTIRKKKYKDEEEVVEFVYKNGVMIQHKDISKGIALITDYIYNEHGDLVEMKCTDGKFEKYSYEYDPFYNWLKRVCISQDGAETITERSIEYF